MHNPFIIFDNRIFHALMKAGHTHFVRQSYKRGIGPHEDEVKGSFLITHYKDLRAAQTHYASLHKDEHRFLYDITNPDHYKKLQMASMGPTGFKIHTSVLPFPWKPGEVIGGKIRTYVNQQLKWNAGRGDEVKSDLFVRHGEIFIALKYRANEVKVPFGVIEGV